MVYPISKLWFYPLSNIFIKRVKGIENIPRNINFIVAANHNKLIDPIYVYYPILKTLNRKLHFVSSPRWWPLLGDIICGKWAGCIPAYDGKTYDNAKQILVNGELLGIFPEGNLKSLIRIPGTGVIRLAMETKTPILPIGIKSSYKPWNSYVNIGRLMYPKNNKRIKQQLQDLIVTLYKLKNCK